MAQGRRWVSGLAALALLGCASLAGLNGSGTDGGQTNDASGPAKDAGASDTSIDALSPCSGSRTCAPAPPEGWTGPVEFYVGNGPPPPCDPDFASNPALDGNDNLDAGNAACTCRCGAPNSVSCSDPSFTLFADPNCFGGTIGMFSLSGTCQDITVPVVTASYKFGPSFPVGGSCIPQSTVTVPDAGWGESARACVPAATPSQGSCPSGEVCAPAPGPSFAPRLCIMQSGEPTCPAPYSVGHVEYLSVADQRTCTPCSCGAATGTACVGSCNLSTGSSCPAMYQDISAQNVCFNGTPPSGYWLYVHSVEGGSCAPDGGQPAGSAEPTGAETVCCLP